MGNGNSSAGNSCNAICWVVAVVFGVVIAVILRNWADWNWLISIVVGVIGMFGAGWLLTSYFCDGQGDSAETPMHAGGITAAGAGDAAADGSHEVDDAARVAKVDPETPAYAGGVTAAGAGEAGAYGTHDVGSGTAEDGVVHVDPDTPDFAGGVTAAGAGVAGADGSHVEGDDPKPVEPGSGSGTPMHAGGVTAAGAGDAAADGSHEVDDAARVAKVDPDTPAYAGGITAAGAGEAGAYGTHDVGSGTAEDGVVHVDPDTPDYAGGVTAAGAGVAGADGSGGADGPQMLASAPDGVGDNLKEIKGVGPKLADTLNELGVYTFAQIAGWGPSDIEWVDERLTFKGRIERDGWVEQAKTLASGNETEFSKRVEDGDVY